MPRFVDPQSRVNFTVDQTGREYSQRLLTRSQAILTNLLNLLPSTYNSSIQGPNYTNELKAVAVELARLELALEDVYRDIDHSSTRSDFIYQIVGYLAFTNGKLPTTTFDDQQFKKFLNDVIKIYFKGAIPDALAEGVGLFISDGVTITENFLLVRQGASGLDISDQFGFQISIDALSGSFPADVFTLDQNLRLILDILRPAHTLFRIRYVFRDSYTPNQDQGGKILDGMRWAMGIYHYDDLRTYTQGVVDQDRLGVKENIQVVGEDHTDDF